MVRKQVFEELGCLDDATFTQGLSDVDLCLRAGKDGYPVVWTPYASLMQATGQSSAQPEEVLQEHEREVFYRKWLPQVARDPAYRHSLRLGASSFILAHSLRTNWNPF